MNSPACLFCTSGSTRMVRQFRQSQTSILGKDQAMWLYTKQTGSTSKAQGFHEVSGLLFRFVAAAMWEASLVFPESAGSVPTKPLLTASQPLAPVPCGREVLWRKNNYPNQKTPCPVTLTREHKHRTAQLLIRTLKKPRQICKVITGIELLTHLRAFFPLRQFKQHASSRKDVMRSGSDNAHQIKCVVKGKCSNQKENQTEFWAEWQRQQLLFLYVHKAAFRILCMTWGLDDMERMIRQLFLLNLKN